MSTAVAADLHAVRELLVTNGWKQGPRGLGDPACRCIIHAIDDLLPGPRGRDVYLAVLRAVPSDDDVSSWNDAPGRTFAEVLALLDKAIAAEEARP